MPILKHPNIHASLDFLGEKHDLRQCKTSGLVGFVSPGIVINDDRGSFVGLYCKFHKITKFEDVWDKYHETISTNKLRPLTPIASKYQPPPSCPVPSPLLQQNGFSMSPPPQSFQLQSVQSKASSTLQKKGKLETRIMILENEVLEMKKQNQRKMEIEKESNKSKFKHLQMDFDKLQGNFNRMQSKLKNIEAKLVTELQKIEQIQDNIDMKLEFFISLVNKSKCPCSESVRCQVSDRSENRLMAEAYASKKNLAKDSVSSTSYVIESEALLSDSRKLNINHEEVAQKMVALAEMEHDSELFATKFGLNNKLLHTALSDLLHLHYGEHVLKQVQIYDQYDDGSGEGRMPHAYNPYIVEEHCKICQNILMKESHMVIDHGDWKISLPLESCQLEYITSEKDHVRHMIMYHPEKVLEDEVAQLVGRSIFRMIKIILTKLKERTRKLKKCLTICNVCGPQNSAICERNKCRCDKRCKHLQWLLIWTKKNIYVKRYNIGLPMIPSFSREEFGTGTVVSPTSSRRWHYVGWHY